MQYIVTFITASNMKEADKIADALVKKRLAACVNIINNVRSVFHWKGRIESSGEVLLIAKSAGRNFNKIVKEVKRLHSYECPEVIALPISAGNEDYLKWIKKETK